MLKIKGLKKKKKGKKGKHKEEDDLFDPQELEQYRREHQQKQEAGETSDTAAAGEGASSSEQSEEWKKFQALTAGVDDILKKTQGDLSRIKETSYFKRKPPGPSKVPGQEGQIYDTKSKKWLRADGSAVEEDLPTAKQPIATSEEPEQPVKEEPLLVEEEEEEEDSEQDEDIFDTSYVDVVASGSVKLAYIPDSPTEEELGPDPFDTSIVDKVIKVDPKKRILVSLGCAVEVLTGRTDKAVPVAESLPAKRKRPKKQDLLLGSFDEVDVLSEDTSSVVVNEQFTKSILDEETEFVHDEIDLSINLAAQLPPPSPLVERKNTPVVEIKDQQVPKSIVEEFDLVGQSTQATVPAVDDELDDEFAALAHESILKEATKEPDTKFEFEENEVEVDPFDTTFAANALPGKFELKLIEEEILFKEHDFPEKPLPKFLEDIPSVRINDVVNEHNFLDEDQTPLSLKHRDLLGGSTTDLSKIGDCPIEPVVPIASDELLYSDPFDTSVVDVLVAPGKSELKFLEKEFLEGVIQIEDSEDFDPRADSSPKSSKPPRPDQLPVGGKRLSIPKVVAFNIDTLEPETDLLAVNQEDSAKVSKPLTPYYAKADEVNNSSESETNLSDPFDTSFVTHAPGKAELKLIESELSTVVENAINSCLWDPEFDPRQEEAIEEKALQKSNPPQPPTNLPIKVFHKLPEKLQPDILSEDSEITAKLHTPVVPKKVEEELDRFDYSDPFDTSAVSDTLPGKAELKLLESELITSEEVPPLKRSYTDPDFNPRHSPVQEEKSHGGNTNNFLDNTEDIAVTEHPLRPEPLSRVNHGTAFVQPLDVYDATDFNESEIDPFDTSCVDNLVPGKTELKLLESELLN